MNRYHKLSLSLAILLHSTNLFSITEEQLSLVQNIKTDTENVSITMPNIEITNIINVNSYYSSGTGENDLIIGRANRDVIYANKDNWSYKNIDAGNDFVFGGKGNDHIEAGRTTGIAYIDGGEGNDKIYGTSTNDENSGIGDVLIGGDGDDIIISNAGDDIVFGGNGNDSFYNRAENGVRDSDNVYVYRGKHTEYIITTENGYTYVEDTIPNRDGKDKIANGYREGTYSAKGDKLQFSDGQIDIITGQFFNGVIAEGISYGDNNGNENDDTINNNENYLSSYNLSQESSSDNISLIEQAIEDTPENGTLVVDLDGEYPIGRSIDITKPIKIVVEENRNFTLKLTQKDEEVIFVKSENVTINGLNINANQKAPIGIYSDYGNISLINNKIYNAYYDNEEVSKYVAGISIVPQQGNNLSATIENNEIFDLTNTLHDQTEGSYGMGRGIFIGYDHIDGINLTIENNYIHNIDAEEDDFIVLSQLDKSVLSDKNHPYLTVIKNNRLIGFTRRGLKIRTSNARIENNILESKNVEDQKNYPAYSAITIFGSNIKINNNTIKLTKHFERAISLDTDGSVKIYDTKIENNNLALEGGDKQQFMIQMQYTAYNYLVQNNTFKMISPYYIADNGDHSSHFFYLKAYTTGEIKDNTFIVENGNATSIVHNNLYRSTTATNTTRLTNNKLIGNIDYYMQFQGLSLSKSLGTDKTEGYMIDVEYTGNANEREEPEITITQL